MQAGPALLRLGVTLASRALAAFPVKSRRARLAGVSPRRYLFFRLGGVRGSLLGGPGKLSR